MESCLVLYKKNNKITIYNGDRHDLVFDFNEYKDIINNIGTDEYNFFNIIKSNYGIKDSETIEKNFLYLFNFILINNISNYIIDNIRTAKIKNIIIENTIRDTEEEFIKLTGMLSIEEVYQNIVFYLKSSNEREIEKIKIVHKNIGHKDLENKKLENLHSNSINEEAIVSDKNIEFFFYYKSEKIREISKRLKEDLVAFKYVSLSEVNEFNRFILPIYLDEPELRKKGIENYNDYLENWLSLSYLHMITKIHDYFIDYYNFDYDKGMSNDDLMLSLMDLLDTDMKPYPQGIKKSIEIGRETSGKSYFIKGAVKPVRLTQELLLILRSKDAFSVVPKTFYSDK